MNSVVHFEIPAIDMKRAQTFYQTVFGWQMNSYMPTYALATTAPTDDKRMVTKPGAINGALQKKDDSIASTRIVVEVPNLDAALKAIQAAGGKVKQGKTEVPGMLWYAVAEDTEGNEVGVIQNIRPA